MPIVAAFPGQRRDRRRVELRPSQARIPDAELISEARTLLVASADRSAECRIDAPYIDSRDFVRMGGDHPAKRSQPEATRALQVG
jgi:hypothetical protein